MFAWLDSVSSQPGKRSSSMAIQGMWMKWPTMVLALLASVLIGLYLSSLTPPIPLSGIAPSDLPTFASHAINNTVVIVPINSGMLHWADNLLCSLRQTSFNTSNIVFWTLDREAGQLLAHRGYATYHDPTLFATSNNENYNGDTKAYRRMMKERPKFFINILSAGYDILMLDADTVWWQSPQLLIPQKEERDAVDIIYSTDSREFFQSHNAFDDDYKRGSLIPPVCNGIFWMKSSPKTIKIWMEMLDVFYMPPPVGWYRRINFQDDQRGMDVLLNDGRAKLVEPLPEGITTDMLPTPWFWQNKPTLKIRLLDQTLVVNGHLLWNRREVYEANLAKTRAQGRDRMAAHFNWRTAQMTKEEGAKALQMYLLDDQGRCKFD